VGPLQHPIVHHQREPLLSVLGAATEFLHDFIEQRVASPPKLCCHVDVSCVATCSSTLPKSRLRRSIMHFLLGMWGEGHKEFPNEAQPCALTFVDTIIVNTPLLLVL
jgi:hypothetical protein